MMQYCVALLCMVAFVAGKPYHGYEQPDYTLEKNQPADKSFEVRRYAAANWTKTSMVDDQLHSSRAFMRLFDYIEGENEEKTKMSMTVPVTIKFATPSCAFCNQTYVMSFYVPKEFQNSAPEPTNPMVVKEPRKEMVAYVRTFDGYAKQMEYVENAMHLYTDLLRNGITEGMVMKDFFFGASYDSPIHVFARRNEVWILAAK